MTPFKQLSEEQQEEIAPLAAQANQWLAALVAVLKQASSRDERALQIMTTLETAMRAALALNPTITFQHFAHECRGEATTQLMTSGDLRFITEVVPRIRILQHVDLTPERWNSFSDAERQKIKQIVAQLGRMVQAFEAYKEAASAQEQQQEAPLDPEIMQMVLSQLPPGAAEQLMQAGGLDAIVRMAQSRMDEESGGGGALAGLGGLGGLGGIGGMLGQLGIGGGAGGLASLVGGLGGTISKFRDRVGQLDENPTPEQKKAFYGRITEFIKDEVHDQQSILSKFADLFEKHYPEGLSPSELSSMLERARGFLIIGGAKKNDSAWFIFKQVKQFHKRMQKKTRREPMLTRSTFATKVITLVQIALETENSVEELIEAATNSDVLKGVAGKFMGMPVAEVTKDPFASKTSRKQIANNDDSDDDSWSSDGEA
jgi:hypothetical protein